MYNLFYKKWLQMISPQQTAPMKNGQVVAEKIDKNAMFIYFISIATRACIIVYIAKFSIEQSAGLQRTLTFAYAFMQLGYLLHHRDKGKRDVQKPEVINLNTVPWWQAWHHILLLPAVIFVNFEFELFYLWLVGDLLLSIIFYTYYRIIKVRRFLRRRNGGGIV